MVYDISENQPTTMVMSKSLFNSCRATKTKGEELTESDFRKNVDLAWRITKEFAGKIKKINTATEPKVIKIEGEVCPTCGSSDLIRTGVCRACLQCGSSLGCS